MVDNGRQFERLYNQLVSELKTGKNEIDELRRSVYDLVQENERLRNELKNSISSQLTLTNLDSQLDSRNDFPDLDKNLIRNLEEQSRKLKKEREDAMQMWRDGLIQITRLEQELKHLQFVTAPQTMSFELELKKREEEFGRAQEALIREMSLIKAESNKKDEELSENQVKIGELKLEIQSLNSHLNQKTNELRNMIRKEYGFDDALITLQNDINDIETKNISLSKDNQHLNEILRDAQNRLNELNKQLNASEQKNADLKANMDENMHAMNKMQIDMQNTRLIEQRNKVENERMSNAIAELMDDATEKTRKEVEALKKIYNSNIEKLIEECSILDMDRNNMVAQLEKALRVKKSLEQELEKISLENERSSDKGNTSYEDLHRRFCLVERERDQAAMKLETRDAEIRKLQSLYESEREKNLQLVTEFTDKSFKSSHELEKLSDEHARCLREVDELKTKITAINAEKEALQKKLTKEIQMHENEVKIRESDNLFKVKCLEENHSKTMFELRQLLNMQQRMGNKWKEECLTITNQSEAKFKEMKKNFDNLCQNNDRLSNELQEMRRKEVELERTIESYSNKVKSLEGRVKDAENQATEVTKKYGQQKARDKLISYEKHLLESNIERNNGFLQREVPSKLK